VSHCPNKNVFSDRLNLPMTVPFVSGLAANCFKLWFQQPRRSCLRNCWTSGWQQALECQQNAFVWHERKLLLCTYTDAESTRSVRL